MSKNSPEGLGKTAKRRSSQKRAWQSYKRSLKYFYWRLVRLQGRPESLARGLACGVFAGLFPFAGSQTVLALLLAFLFQGNKILATVGPWISNPLTSVPIYLFNFQVGKWLLQDNSQTDVSFESWQDIMQLGSEVFLPLLIGCVAVGLICAVCSYFLGLWLIHRVRTSNLKRHRRKRSKHLHEKYPEQY
jgi:uncharacterized protein